MPANETSPETPTQWLSDAQITALWDTLDPQADEELWLLCYAATDSHGDAGAQQMARCEIARILTERRRAADPNAPAIVP